MKVHKRLAAFFRKAIDDIFCNALQIVVVVFAALAILCQFLFGMLPLLVVAVVFVLVLLTVFCALNCAADKSMIYCSGSVALPLSLPVLPLVLCKACCACASTVKSVKYSFVSVTLDNNNSSLNYCALRFVAAFAQLSPAVVLVCTFCACVCHLVCERERGESEAGALNYVATMLLCELLLLLLLLVVATLFVATLCCCCCWLSGALRRCDSAATSGNACACIALIAATNICTTPVAHSPLLALALSLSHSPGHIPCQPMCILPSFYLLCSLSSLIVYVAADPFLFIVCAH